MAFPNRPKKSVLEKRKITNPVIQTRNRLIGAAVVGGVLCLATFFLYTNPAMSQASSTHAALMSARSQLTQIIAETQIAESNPQQLCLQVAHTFAQTQALDKLLPSNIDKNALELTVLPRLIAQSGASGPGAFQTPTASTEFGVSVYTYSIQITGSIAQINSFINLVNAQPQLLTISDYSLSSASSSSKTPGYVATMSINAWYMPGIGSSTANASTSAPSSCSNG